MGLARLQTAGRKLLGAREYPVHRGSGRGDVITEIDGAPLSTLLDRWRPYYGASNEAARLRDIAINRISSVKAANVREYIHAAEGAKGLILDLRGAPSEPIWQELRRLLPPEIFAHITTGDLSNPGAFEWSDVRVVPTIAGIAAGVDEVVEEAKRRIEKR
jgi:hypothetical protein